MFRISLLLAASILPATTLYAQTSGANTPADDFHNDADTIVVTGVGLKQLDVLAGTSVLDGGDLIRNLEPQIGDVLTGLPGVSATSFAPGASRPVLRGFQGVRVRVLTDGIGSIDVSNTSADHAVSIDPLTAERVEVLRGPAVLIYGSQAIGGAVNIIGKQIPRSVPEEAVHIDGLLSLGTASDLRMGGLSADVALTPEFAFHLNGAYTKTDDLSVGGFTVAPELRADLLAEAAEEEAEEPEEAAELREAAAQRGVLPNSATETLSLGTGLAFVNSRGSLGVSVSYFDTDYGVPGRPGAGHGHGEEEGESEEGEEEGEAPVSIALEQFRADLRGNVIIGGDIIDEIRVRAGYANYTHTEFEGDEVGTVFDVEGIEGRLELVQPDIGGWSGAVGAQYYARDFVATGAEAFLPPNETEQFGLFALQEVPIGPLQLELAGRFEHTEVDARENGSRNFNTVSGAVGLAHELKSGLRIGISGSRAERAPSAEELFSNGPHIATQAFEIGDPNLVSEKSWGAEIFARGDVGKLTFSASVFGSWFDDYIYEERTGEEEDDLPVFVYLQQDADYIGVELSVSAPLFETGGFTIIGDAVGDYIRAELSDGTAVPRIPPLRLLGGLEAQSEAFDARVEVEWTDTQGRTAEFETDTANFTLVNASVAWRPLGTENVTLRLQAENIFDVDARRHASFTKDFVPLSGRDFRASLRFSF